MRLIAFVAEGRTARGILEHLGLDATGPPIPRAQARPGPYDPVPDYDLPDAAQAN